MGDGRLRGRVGLVTGGASGIGQATVSRLREDGARIAVLDLDEPEVECDLAVVGDVSDSELVERAVAKVEEELGPLQILVCAAGIGVARPTAELTDEEWQRTFAVNAGGTFACNRAALARMAPRRAGRIVNLASAAAKDGTTSAAYSGSKAAVIGMTKFLGREAAASGVLVNCVAPGPIDTPLLRSVGPEQMEALVSALPIGRVGKPQEVAALISFLVSDELSFTAGFCFDASGGRAPY